MFTTLKNKQLLLSAILLTLIFFISGINKAKSVKDTAKSLHSKIPFLNINFCNYFRNYCANINNFIIVGLRKIYGTV